MDVNEASRELHQIFESITRHSFPFDKVALPLNGIYILYEKEEMFGDIHRILRIGSHTGKDRFIKRLKDHFMADKQRNSIFRKHLGRCFLKKADDPYKEKWDPPFKKIVDKQKYKDKVDLNYEKKYEKKITRYIRESFSFVVIPNLTDDGERLGIESTLIATTAQDTITKASENWLGKWHPDEKICKGKLWNINHLEGETISDDQMNTIKKKLKLS